MSDISLDQTEAMSTGDGSTAAQVTRTVRLWSPLTVAVCALLLGYPAGVVLAWRNWRSLGMRREANAHLIGALLFSLLFGAVLLFSSTRIGRVFGLASSIAAFSYLKAKLQSDVAAAKAADPNLLIDDRRWYAGLGWILLAYLVFFFLAFIVMIIAIVADIPIPD